jgi:class 3 adenylate cyclase/predicted ATPase
VTDGERKSITALFADIKGSTDLIADLDPEEARRIIDPTLQLMMDAVHRYEGYVAQSLGDGVFALFGAPIAHEDHPQRALYAALLMQEESRKRAEQLRREEGINLQIRVGVNTGEVVLRSIRKDDLHTDYVPVGQSTNLASRMESLATPGAILVSEQTYRLTEGYFEFKALGQAQVKGFTEPLPIYEVAGVGPLRTKLQLSARRGLARFVGRQSELEQLQRAWESAKAGHGQIAGVMGEPGVGKSRLFYEFKFLSQRGCLVLETFSVSHGKAYPYLPLIDLLKNYFQLTNQDDERRRREKLTGRVLTLDRSLEDILPYLFFLLGIAEPTSPLQQMDPQIRRKRILEAIRRLLVRESLNQPLIVIFEDLHWLDAETQAFLELLSESVATARILLLVNYRPEYHHPWSGKTYFSQLRLDPLGKVQAEEMLTALLGDAVGATGRSPLHQFILDKTEGNPFFMEEIVQELREQGIFTRPDVGAALRGRPPQGAHMGAPLQIPTTVQGVLAARMDRLPPEEKALLQTLAVIGREFSSSLIRKVVTQPEDALLKLLSRLQAREFVYEQPAFPEPEYIFKHALTQEVAYNSLLIERRKVLHERTAQAIEEVYRYKLDDHYSELAHHYSRSGNTQKAIDYLRLAGQQAVQRSANTEAITHLTTALELLKTLPDTPERAQQELALHIALGGPLRTTKGYSAPEVEKTYSRARELCQQVGEPAQLFSVLRGLFGVYMARGPLSTGRELAEQLLRIAQREQETSLLLQAHHAMGMALTALGEYTLARAHLEQGITLYEPRQHHSVALLFGLDPGIDSRSWLAEALWYLGYPNQALERLQEALTLASDLPHRFNFAAALFHAAKLHRLRREDQQTRKWSEAAIAIATEHGFPLFLGWSKCHYGWALVEQGQEEEGIAQMRQGSAIFETTGSQVYRSNLILAETYGKVGQPEQGLGLLAEAFISTNRTEERWYEVELYRLKGELTLQKFKVQSSEFKVSTTQPLTSNTQAEAEAEACFFKAIEIAQKQQAKSLELRATMSLARLRQQQASEQGAGSGEQGVGSTEQGARSREHVTRARLDEARNMLSEVYNWFTEGFDTKDLQEAKALIESLSH